MTGAGAITLNVTSPSPSPNLDIKAELHDALGVVVASADPTTSLNATISYTAPAPGTYTLIVDGVGKGDLATGYSDYASLGEYTISGTIVNPGVAQPPVAVASATPTSGVAPLEVTFNGGSSSDPDGTISVYAWSFGDGGTADTSVATHTYLSAGVYTAVLTVTDNAGFSDTASIVITVTGAPTAPAAPAALTATAASSSQINLAWTDSSNDEDGFWIEQSL